jgi:cytochrome P450
LSRLITEPDALTYREVAWLYMTLVLVGIDTVTATIGFVLLELARNPQLRNLLREDPEQLAPFIDEIVRLDGPIYDIARQTTREVVIGGETLPAGARLGLHVGSVSNADGAEVRMRDGKVRRGHNASCGVGPHRCIGTHLAALEVKLLLTEWLRAIPDFALEVGFTPNVVFARALGVDRLEKLPLTWSP